MVFKGLVKVVQYTTTFVGFLASGFRRLSDVAGGLIPLLKTMGLLLLSLIVGKLVMGIYNMAKGFIAVARSLTLVNATAMLLPLLIGAAIVLAGLIIDDFIAFLDGRPSVLGFLIKNKDKILASIKKFIGDMLEWLDTAFLKFFDLIQMGIAAFLKFFGVPAEQAGKTAAIIVDAFRWMYQDLKAGLVIMGEAFVATFNYILDFLKPIVQLISDIIAEPFAFLDFLGQSVKDVFTSMGEWISGFIKSAIESLIYLIELPSKIFDTLLEYIQTGIGKAYDFVSGLVKSIIGVFDTLDTYIKDKVGSFAGGALSFFGDMFGSGDKVPETAPMTQSSIAQGAQNSVNNRTANSSTVVSPTINVSVSGEGGMNTADDIARKIRDEIAGVAEGMSRSAQPQFAQ